MSIAFNEGSQILDSDAYNFKDLGTSSKFMDNEEDEDDYYENVQLGSGRSYGGNAGNANESPRLKLAEQMSP